MTFTDKKKITISTSKKENKIYRTYQININNDYIRMLNDDDPTDTTNHKIKLYLIEKNKQSYQITTNADTINKVIETQIKINDKKTTSPLTLPKNDMEYIKAYDTYLNKIDKINTTGKQFKPAPLNANILLVFKINADNLLGIELSITNLRVNIDDGFINYIQQEYKDIKPDWLNTLLTDWNNEYLNQLMNIK